MNQMNQMNLSLLSPISQERLTLVILGGLRMMGERGATAEGTAFTLRRLGIDVRMDRVWNIMNKLTQEGKLEIYTREKKKLVNGKMRPVLAYRISKTA